MKHLEVLGEAPVVTFCSSLMLRYTESVHICCSPRERAHWVCVALSLIPRSWCHLIYLRVLRELALKVCLMEPTITPWCELSPKASGKFINPVLNTWGSIKPWGRTARGNLSWAEDWLGWKGYLQLPLWESGLGGGQQRSELLLVCLRAGRQGWQNAAARFGWPQPT